MNYSRKKGGSASYVSLDETSRALLDASVESALIMDPAGHVLAANDAAARLFGQENAASLERENLYSLLPEENGGKRAGRKSSGPSRPPSRSASRRRWTSGSCSTPSCP